MDCDRFIFSGHAVRRMFERRITRDDVIDVVRNGETIAEYPDDRPFPSELRLGFSDNNPLHVVVAFDQNQRGCYVITAYDPDPDLWDAEFRQRKPRP